MLTLWSVCLLYLAVFAFHQAGERRTSFAGLKSSGSKRRLVRIAGWGIALLALFMTAQPQGLERGVPVWLAAFMLAAFACLLVGSLLPKRHVESAVVALVLAAVLSVGLIWRGSA
ncbi:MAG: DUF3325 family protein [Pseudomonadota bacterium]